MSGGGEGFLARWSRRKRQAAEAVPERVPEAPAPLAEPLAEPPESPPQAGGGDGPPAFDPASLPPVESLTPESDITGFLRAEVPDALRQAALRRIWSLDPAIRDFIGPADYAWDYNAPDGVPGFSPTLGGDVKRLLAQAIGLEEERETEPPSVAPEAGAPPEPAPREPELASPEPAPPGLASPSLASPGPAPPEPDATPPVAEAALPDPPAGASVPPRRHGGALPS